MCPVGGATRLLMKSHVSEVTMVSENTVHPPPTMMAADMSRTEAVSRGAAAIPGGRGGMDPGSMSGSWVNNNKYSEVPPPLKGAQLDEMDNVYG